MSLKSFKLYREMARMSRADTRRGKKAPGTKDSGDRVRLALNNDEIRLFLYQQKDDGTPAGEPIDSDLWARAVRERHEHFVNKTLFKIQDLVEQEMKKGGTEEAIFYYLKYGLPHPDSSKQLSKEVIDLIRNGTPSGGPGFNVVEGEGLSVGDKKTPDQVRGIIKDIKEFLEDFKKASFKVLSDDKQESVKQLIDTVEKKDESDVIRDRDLLDRLKQTHKSLARDNELESIAQMIAYEAVRKNTVDSRDFWNRNKLDEPIELVFEDKRKKSGATKIKVNPFFFRYYHWLERTKGTDHVEELQQVLGKSGGYGLDLKYPIKDEKTGGVTTLGADFGTAKSNAGKFDEKMRKFFRHHSYGHFGDHFESLGDDVVWKPVKVANKEVEDPLYDWMLKSIVKSISKTWEEEELVEIGPRKDPKTGRSKRAIFWKGETTNLGPDGRDLTEEEYRKFFEPDGSLKMMEDIELGTVSQLAYSKAREALVNLAKEGKLIAPPVPCTEASKKAGFECPSVEERKYKVCQECRGFGSSIAYKGKKGSGCSTCGGTGVETPLVYLPHKMMGSKLVPLINSSSYQKRVEPDSEEYQDLLDDIKDRMGDHFTGDGFEHQVPGSSSKKKVGFPVWAPHSVDDTNAGQSDYTTFGPMYNKNTSGATYISPDSVEGRKIRMEYLSRDDKGFVTDFIKGIRVCVSSVGSGRGGCGGAPGPVMKVISASLEDVHEIIYNSALENLGAMRPKVKIEVDEETEEKREVDIARITFATTQTSNIAQNLMNSKTGETLQGGLHSRRGGYVAAAFTAGSSGSDTEVGGFDPSSKGYDRDDLGTYEPPKTRGLPTGTGIGKFRTKQRVAEILGADAKRVGDLATSFKQKEDAALSGIAANPSDPWDSLKKRFAKVAENRVEFEKKLKELLISPQPLGLGKTEAEADDMILNFKDDTIESIIKSLEPKKAKTATFDPLRPVVPKPVGKPGGLAGRLKAIKGTQVPQPTTGPQPAQPSADPVKEPPTVDWSKLSGLSLSERVNYLKKMLRG